MSAILAGYRAGVKPLGAAWRERCRALDEEFDAWVETAGPLSVPRPTAD